jgi:surface polysaccharide O-acyltransferase-like enzyme
MSYFTYKLIHYFGIFLLIAVLGAALGRRSATTEEDPLRKRWAALHGVALFVILVGGFGLMARVGVEHGELFPGWIWAKFGIWGLLGGVLFLARRWRHRALTLLAVVPLLAVLAGYLAFRKPF